MLLVSATLYGHRMSSRADEPHIVDPQIKRNLERQLADAQANLAIVEEEEKQLSAQDKEIHAAGKAYKEAHVSACVQAYGPIAAKTSAALLPTGSPREAQACCAGHKEEAPEPGAQAPCVHCLLDVLRYPIADHLNRE